MHPSRTSETGVDNVVVAFVFVAVATAPILAVATAGLARTVGFESHTLTGPVSVLRSLIPLRAARALLLPSRRRSGDLAGLTLGISGGAAVFAGNPATATAVAVLVVPPGSTASVCHLSSCGQQLAVRPDLRVRSFEQDRQLV